MRELAEGVWQVPTLLRGLINCYLIRTSEGDVLIDAATRWASGRILQALREYPVTLVALTHVHPDHQGAAAAVCRHFRVPLACHEADAGVMEGARPMQPANWIVTLGDRLWSGPCHPVARRLRDGDQIGEWRVIHTPGHTPGHVMYYRERDRVLLAGDLVRNSFRKGRPLIAPPRLFSVDPELNRQSIQRLTALRPSLICCGHGPPRRGVPLEG